MSEEWSIAGPFASPCSSDDLFGPSSVIATTEQVLSATFPTTDSAGHMHFEHEFLNSFSEGGANTIRSFDDPPDQDLCKQIREQYSVTGDLDRLCIDDDKDPGVHFKEKLEARAKRSRSQNWSPEEKRIYLEAKVEALSAVKGKDWDFISQRLQSRKFERSSKCCEDLWGTLLKAYRAVRAHQSLESGPQTAPWISYWDMDEDGRSRKKLPRFFPLEWCKMMERILDAQEKRRVGSQGKTTVILMQKSFEKEDHIEHAHLKYLVDPDGSHEHTQGKELRMIITNSPVTSNWKHTSGRKGSDAAVIEQDAKLVKLLAPLVKQQVEEAVNSALERLSFRKRSGATTEQDGLMASIAPHVKQQVEAGVNYALQILDCTGTTIDEDTDLIIARLAPFVKTQIEEALNSALQPVSLVLQVRQEKEQEAAEVRLQAIRAEKRALDREEKLIKRHRVGRHAQRPRRASTTQQGRRGNLCKEDRYNIERVEHCL